MLEVGAQVGVPADGEERDPALPFGDRLRLPAQVGEGQAAEDMPLAIVGGGPELLLDGEPGRVGVDPRLGRVPAQLVGLGADDGPRAAVVVPGTWREREEVLLLAVVQHPVEVPIVPEDGQEGRGLDSGEGGAHDRPRAREVALAEGHHGLVLDAGEVGGAEREGPVQGHLSLGVAAQIEQRERSAPRRVGGTGVERARLGQTRERRLPTAQALLRQGRRREQVDVVGRQLEPGLGGQERLSVVHRHVPVVGT